MAADSYGTVETKISDASGVWLRAGLMLKGMGGQILPSLAPNEGFQFIQLPTCSIDSLRHAARAETQASRLPAPPAGCSKELALLPDY